MRLTSFLHTVKWLQLFCFGWLFYGISTLFRSFNAELSQFDESLYVSRSSYLQILQLNVKTVPIQTIQFSISTIFCLLS